MSRCARTALVAAAVLSPALAWAQETAPPQPRLNRYAPAWLGFLVMFVLLGLVLFVSLLPSKRGHQK